jgi:hypothetical protein
MYINRRCFFACFLISCTPDDTVKKRKREEEEERERERERGRRRRKRERKKDE